MQSSTHGCGCILLSRVLDGMTYDHAPDSGSGSPASGMNLTFPRALSLRCGQSDSVILEADVKRTLAGSADHRETRRAPSYSGNSSVGQSIVLRRSIVKSNPTETPFAEHRPTCETGDPLPALETSPFPNPGSPPPPSPTQAGMNLPLIFHAFYSIYCLRSLLNHSSSRVCRFPDPGRDLTQQRLTPGGHPPSFL